MDGVRLVRGCLDRCLEMVQIGLFGAMVAVGTYQILVRYLFNKPSTMSEELLTYAFAWLSLLAAAYMFGKQGHMRMGFLADRASGGGKLALQIISECLVFFFGAVVMVYGGVKITSLTMAQKTASLGIPMGYIYSIVPVCGGLILMYSLFNFIEMAGEKDKVKNPPEWKSVHGKAAGRKGIKEKEVTEKKRGERE